ncbi:hypothetical protein F5883DRAFT_650339 [Diaporthe sp. PMI_573]|nr:hypothetical protein F5883DRAFT_652748 [Diaporthaceae sp. PMI_573]KAH8750335.1 hypothetical protein F5883DRAFT_652387 [Diaporthaceae sp. PMI_573]KAH8754860.1 hypothetical protein F5883DRAFT_650339 [Diaporthaceae sp. PMI_573]
MVIGLLVLASIPTVTGVAQGISAKKQNAKLKEKINFNMTATLQDRKTVAWVGKPLTK